MSLFRIVKKFQSILSEHQKFRIVNLAFLMVIGGVLEIGSISLMIPFMDMLMDTEAFMNKESVQCICNILHIHSSKTLLITVAITLAGVYIFKNIYLLLEYNFQYRFVYGNMFAMQRRILYIFIHKPYEFFLKVKSGELIRIVNGDTASTFQLLVTLLNLFTELIVSGMLIITIFVFSPGVTTAIAIILGVLLIGINILLKPRLRKAGIEYQESSAGMMKWLLQSIEGIKEMKVMTREEFFQRNFDYNGQVYVNSLRKNQILSLAPKYFIEALSMGAMFIFIAAMVYRGNGIDSYIPVLSAVAMAAMRLLPSVSRISNSMALVSYNEPMLDKLIESLEKIEEDSLMQKSETKPEKGKQKKVDKLKFVDRLVFDSITFQYPASEQIVLKNATMRIHRGESVAIVGASGAGKTTTVDIILGLLHPSKGKVLIDGVDVMENIEAWLHQIGYIPQSIFMLDDTIKANVAFGIDANEISEDKVWEALREASLDEFVKYLPEGIETPIGERGMRLSGGQRQRIGIARALYMDPEVLIFDEATSALDNETESEIMESLNNLRGRKTMIIIAHRLSTIQGCDHIFRVENGQIIRER